MLAACQDHYSEYVISLALRYENWKVVTRSFTIDAIFKQNLRIPCKRPPGFQAIARVLPDANGRMVMGKFQQSLQNSFFILVFICQCVLANRSSRKANVRMYDSSLSRALSRSLKHCVLFQPKVLKEIKIGGWLNRYKQKQLRAMICEYR